MCVRVPDEFRLKRTTKTYIPRAAIAHGSALFCRRFLFVQEFWTPILVETLHDYAVFPPTGGPKFLTSQETPTRERFSSCAPGMSSLYSPSYLDLQSGRIALFNEARNDSTEDVCDCATRFFCSGRHDQILERARPAIAYRSALSCGRFCSCNKTLGLPSGWNHCIIMLAAAKRGAQFVHEQELPSSGLFVVVRAR